MIDSQIKIVILGATSRVGIALKDYFYRYTLIEPELFTRLLDTGWYLYPGNSESVSSLNYYKLKESMLRIKPNFIINSIGYHGVIPCEKNKKKAWELNARVTENVSRLARLFGSHVIMISTDKVFNGKNGPYTEIAKPEPVTTFGRTKLAAENILMSNSIDSTIIRASLIYGHSIYNSRDWVPRLVKKLKNHQPVIVDDSEYMNPIHSEDLAQIIIKIISKKRTGLYHVGSREISTKLGFFRQIADAYGLDSSLIIPKSQVSNVNTNYGLITLKTETDLGVKVRSAGDVMRSEVDYYLRDKDSNFNF